MIDEARKTGIGKTLLSKALEMLQRNKNCLGVYLHVIKNNKSAINFYISNNFSKGKVLENYYHIQKNYYDCLVFYKILNCEYFVFNSGIEKKKNQYINIRNSDYV